MKSLLLVLGLCLASVAQVSMGGGTLQGTNGSSKTFGVSVTIGIGRNDLNPIVLPAVPPQAGPNVCTAGNLYACKNYTGAGTCWNDPNFGSRVCRITDITKTKTGVVYQTMVSTGTGSSDLTLFNCNSTRIIVDDSGGRTFPMIFSDVNGNMSATKMYLNDPTWGAVNGFYVNGGTSWAKNCNTPNYLYTLQGTVLGHYDMTSTTTVPSFVQEFDFQTCLAHAAGVGTFTPTWTSWGGSDQFDNDFAVGFSNNGGQAGVGALYIAVWRRGSGCRVAVLGSLTVPYADWGPTGALTGITCTTAVIHNVKIAKGGGTLGRAEVSVNNNCAENHASPYVWNYPTLTLQPQCTTQCSGHTTEGISHWFNQASNTVPFYWVVRPIDSPGSPTGLTPALPSGGLQPGWDWHGGWEQKDDTAPIMSSSTTNGYAVSATWGAEIFSINPVTPQNPTRYASTYSMGVNQNFSTANATGGGSQDGKYYLFSSDQLGTLGCSTTTGGQVAAATCIPGGPPWKANTAYSANFVLSPGETGGLPEKLQNNSSGSAFQSLAACTSGATVPASWATTIGSTTADGTCIWTNIGIPNLRGDVFVVKVQ